MNGIGGDAFAIIGKRRGSPDQTAQGLQDNEWSTNENDQAETTTHYDPAAAPAAADVLDL